MDITAYTANKGRQTGPMISLSHSMVTACKVLWCLPQRLSKEIKCSKSNYVLQPFPETFDPEAQNKESDLNSTESRK